MSEAMNYKLPPLPDLLEKAIRNLASACRHSDDWKVRAAAAESLRGEIRAYAIAAIEALAVPDGVVLQIDAAVTQAQKLISDWNEWYGMHGDNAPIPPGGIVKAQEMLSVAKSLLAAAPPAPQASVVQQEPVAWIRPSGKAMLEAGGYCTVYASDGMSNHSTPLYTHPAPQAKTQPLSETANVRGRWNIELDGDDLLVCFNDHDKGESCSYQRYVPAQQAKPQPLSDEQIELLMRSIGTTYADDNDERMRNHAEWQRMNHRQIVRAIEAAHGITKE